MGSTDFGIHIHELSRLCHITVVWVAIMKRHVIKTPPAIGYEGPIIFIGHDEFPRAGLSSRSVTDCAIR
jgi:hypothetical protein